MEEGLLGYNPAIGIKPLLLDDSVPREPFSREEVLVTCFQFVAHSE